MTLSLRRLIYLSFIISFFIIAPLTIFYTIGWRWNFYKNHAQKIGNLTLKTFPKQVNIAINDNWETRTTPANYRHLLPNQYNIKINKDGYYDWEKNLNIKSGETTFAEHIYLFKKNQSIIPIIEDNIDFWIYDDKHKSILWQGNDNLYIFNFFTNTSEVINKLPEKIITAYWQHDNKSILIESKNNWYIWRRDNPTILNNLSINSLKPLTKCRWLENEIKISCLSDGSLLQINPVSLESQITINNQEGKIIDFYKNNGIVYILQQNLDDHNVSLKTIKPNEVDQSPIYLLPASSDYRFIRIKNTTVTILDKDHQNLYLLNLDSNQKTFNRTSRIITDITNAFYPNDYTLIYNNDREVWIEQNNKQSLITRQSDKINNIFWHPSDNHLLIDSSGYLKMIELDDRDKRNTAEIIKNNKIEKSALSADGNEILLSFIEDNLPGIFKLEILPTSADSASPTSKQ